MPPNAPSDAAPPGAVDRTNLAKIGLTVALLVIVLVVGHPAFALLIGAGLSLLLSPSLPISTKKAGKLLLQTAIVGLGFTLNIANMWETSQSYAGLISLYVLGTLAIGLGIGRMLAANVSQARLIASGTAICGGTAIATLAPVIRARAEDIGVCLTVVFMLNAVAIVLLPWAGQALDMTQQQFGVWAALAIHDTSSVVGAAAIYGEEALEVATTVKLARTLWLIPLVLVAGILMRQEEARLRIPGFVLAFVAASALGSLMDPPAAVVAFVKIGSQILLVAALFCVGMEVTRATLKAINARVLWLALGLWALVLPITLGAALNW